VLAAQCRAQALPRACYSPPPEAPPLVRQRRVGLHRLPRRGTARIVLRFCHRDHRPLGACREARDARRVRLQLRGDSGAVRIRSARLRTLSRRDLVALIGRDARLHLIGQRRELWCGDCGEPPLTGWVICQPAEGCLQGSWESEA
jgi:hypothetical protein